jgi:hypothetical protein
MVYSGKDLSIQRACHPRTMIRRAASLLEDWISHALTVLVLGHRWLCCDDPLLPSNKIMLWYLLRPWSCATTLDSD